MNDITKAVADLKPGAKSLLDDQLVDMTFITTFSGMTDKWIYRLISERRFPSPIKLGRSSRWLRSEVENWMQARIDESRKQISPE